MQFATLLAALLGLTASVQALQCYTCRGKSVDVGGVGGMVSGNAKPCTEFEKTDEFTTTCSDNYNKACLTVNRHDGVIRGCANVDKDQCSEDGRTCYCQGDLCNGSARGWPSAVLLLAAVLAALAGWRR